MPDRRETDRLELVRHYWKRWSWFEQNSRPWRRLAIHYEFMKRGAYVRWPLHGNALEALRAGRMEMGYNTHFDHDVWVSVMGQGRLKLGRHSILNPNVFVSVIDYVELGDYSGVANGGYVADAQRNFLGPPKPFLFTGIRSKGPTIIGNNVWVGVNACVMSGVTIGDWTIIGANSVVTSDIPSGVLAAGVPARVVKEFDFKDLAEEQAKARPVPPLPSARPQS